MSESNTTVDQFVVFFWARWPVGLFPWSSLVGCEVVVLISLPWPYHCYYISHNNNLVFSNCCSSRPLWATGGRIWSASWFSRGHWGDFHLICGLFILHQENPGFLTPLASLQNHSSYSSDLLLVLRTLKPCVLPVCISYETTYYYYYFRLWRRELWVSLC